MMHQLESEACTLFFFLHYFHGSDKAGSVIFHLNYLRDDELPGIPGIIVLAVPERVPH